MTKDRIVELQGLLPPVSRGDTVAVPRVDYEQARAGLSRLITEHAALLDALRAVMDRVPKDAPMTATEVLSRQAIWEAEH